MLKGAGQHIATIMMTPCKEGLLLTSPSWLIHSDCRYKDAFLLPIIGSETLTTFAHIQRIAYSRAPAHLSSIRMRQSSCHSYRTLIYICVSRPQPGLPSLVDICGRKRFNACAGKSLLGPLGNATKSLMTGSMGIGIVDSVHPIQAKVTIPHPEKRTSAYRSKIPPKERLCHSRSTVEGLVFSPRLKSATSCHGWAEPSLDFIYGSRSGCRPLPGESDRRSNSARRSLCSIGTYGHGGRGRGSATRGPVILTKVRCSLSFN